jgi:hypothetical protein
MQGGGVQRALDARLFVIAVKSRTSNRATVLESEGDLEAEKG